MKALHQTTAAFKQSCLKAILLILTMLSSHFLYAQCPSNVDFEQGNFTNWECWVGNVAVVANKNIITWNPNLPVDPRLYPDRFQMLSSVPGDGQDQYGLFPRNCPNGSGHSIQLGNDLTGAQAEGVSYTFTIPAGRNEYNLIYNYAVVFQDPGHLDIEQPRMVIEVKNLTDGTIIECSSFPFIATSGLPGFFVSPVNGGVLCKDWSATSINLDGNAGKTIQIFFKTADCTRSGHFGYAYVDVNTECSSSFIGAAYCPDDAFINVTAPFGYQSYAWWNAADPSQTIIGTSQTINFTPPPPAGTVLNVAVAPYAGYGCNDTLTAVLMDTLSVFAQAGPDRIACNRSPVQLGINPTVNFLYSWSPSTGLSNPRISNPLAAPTVTTTYILTVTNAGGGCLTRDTVKVSAAILDSSLLLTGLTTFCNGDPQAAVMKVQPADSIQWYRNGIAIPGATQTQYTATQTGAYHATVFSFIGCSSNTPVTNITVHDVPVAGFATTSSSNQCFKNNQFVFTNTSTIASGTMQYSWDMGDGTILSSTDANHSYTKTGTYTVKLLVTSGNGCVDSFFRTVTVYPNASVAADINSNAQCFKNNNFIFTNNSTVEAGATLQYVWTLGDGSTFFIRDVAHSYTTPGPYTVKLLVTTDKGCADSISMNVRVHPSPVAGFTVNNQQQCHGGNDFALTNTSTVLSGTLNYNWDFGDGNTATTMHVNHNYIQPGDYRIKMQVTSDSGCTDISFRDVKVFAYPFADFFVKDPACINQEVLMVNKTLNNTASTLTYVWDFGNGNNSIVRSPSYSYPAPGNYILSLSVSTVQCPTSITTKTIPIVIEAPAPGIVYPEVTAVFNFAEKLQARQIGNNIIWSPATSLDNRFSYTPSFRGIHSQLYTIQLKTPSGCITIDTQFVKAKKKIEIYVPTVFTPGNDGKNDYLRPLLMGFDHVNYFRVFDRWGRLLYQMNSDRPGWDGKLKGQPAEMQTVVWMIEAVDVDGVTHKKQGTTVLIR